MYFFSSFFSSKNFFWVKLQQNFPILSFSFKMHPRTQSTRSSTSFLRSRLLSFCSSTSSASLLSFIVHLCFFFLCLRAFFSSSFLPSSFLPFLPFSRSFLLSFPSYFAFIRLSSFLLPIPSRFFLPPSPPLSPFLFPFLRLSCLHPLSSSSFPLSFIVLSLHHSLSPLLPSSLSFAFLLSIFPSPFSSPPLPPPFPLSPPYITREKHRQTHESIQKAEAGGGFRERGPSVLSAGESRSCGLEFKRNLSQC